VSRQYGRIPRSGNKGPSAARPTEIQINIQQTYTIEQFHLEVQRALGKLQDYGAIGLARFRARLMPLDEAGKDMVLLDEQGQPVTEINIPELAPVKPYRENEPGVGVLPSAAPKRVTQPGAMTPPNPSSRPPGAVPPRGR
jgi:hypothetical protein